MISLLHVVCVSACLIVLFLFLDLTQLKECKWSFFSLIPETLVISLPPGWLLRGVFLPSLLTRPSFSQTSPPLLSVEIPRTSRNKTIRIYMVTRLWIHWFWTTKLFIPTTELFIVYCSCRVYKASTALSSLNVHIFLHICGVRSRCAHTASLTFNPHLH